MGRTSIVLDERLVREGLRRFRCRSKRELVHLALTELLNRAQRRDLFGTARSGEVGSRPRGVPPPAVVIVVIDTTVRNGERVYPGGLMSEITMNVPDEALLALKLSPDQLAAELRLAAAV